MVDRFDALQRKGFILLNTAWLFWYLALESQGSIETICLNDFATSKICRFPSFTKFLGHPSRRLGVVSSLVFVDVKKNPFHQTSSSLVQKSGSNFKEKQLMRVFTLHYTNLAMDYPHFQ